MSSADYEYGGNERKPLLSAAAESSTVGKRSSLKTKSPGYGAGGESGSSSYGEGTPVEGSPTPAPATGFAAFDTRRKVLLLFLCLAGLLAALSVSILTPFFPREAAKKGVSERESSWIFSIFAVIEFFFCPMWGLLLPKIGLRFMYTTSTVFSSASTFLFGILDEIPDNQSGTFFWMCLLVRTCESIGMSAYLTAMFSVVASEFSDGVTTAFSLVQTFHGLGFMLGPPVGGLLYQIGGYKVPFMVLGGALFLTSLSNCLFAPISRNSKPGEGEGEGGGGDKGKEEVVGHGSPLAMLKLLRFPLILLLCVNVIWVAFIAGAIQPTFEPRLRNEYNLNPALVGLVFFAYPSCFTLLTPLVGLLCQKVPGIVVISVGCIGMGVGITLFAPNDWLFPPDFKSLYLVVGSLMVWGAMGACMNVPSMELLIDTAIIGGYASDISLHGLISGMWASSDALGMFTGPVLGAYLVELWGFRQFFTYLAFAPVVLGLLFLLLIIFTNGAPLRYHEKSVELQLQRLMEEEKADREEEEDEEEAEGEEGPVEEPPPAKPVETYVPITSDPPKQPEPGDGGRVTEPTRVLVGGPEPRGPNVPAIARKGRRMSGPVHSRRTPYISVGPTIAEDDETSTSLTAASGGGEDATRLARALEAHYLRAQISGLHASSTRLSISRPSLADVQIVQKKIVRARRQSQQIERPPPIFVGRTQGTSPGVRDDSDLLDPNRLHEERFSRRQKSTPGGFLASGGVRSDSALN